MRPYLVRPPKVYRWLFSEATFRLSHSEKIVYLTFDDGPTPEVTPFVLETLMKHGIKATFFLLGKNAIVHPQLVERIKHEGHTIGNHGMSHLNAWTSGIQDYISDVEAGRKATGSRLFRPPYGKLKPSQYKALIETEKIVFWDVISGDFDQAIDGKRVVSNVTENVRNGSIIVMHDSIKALDNVKSSLSEIIEQLTEKGYSFSRIEAKID